MHRLMSKGAQVSFLDFSKDKSMRKQRILKVKRKTGSLGDRRDSVRTTSMKALSSDPQPVVPDIIVAQTRPTLAEIWCNTQQVFLRQA